MSSQAGLDEFEFVGDRSEAKPEQSGTVLDRAGQGARYCGNSRNRGKPKQTGVKTPTCTHCGGHVSKEYVRVNGIDGTVDVCPNCRADQTTRVGGGSR